MSKEHAMAAIEITAENFEHEVLNSDKPVLLDFWAIWCGPCMMLSPVVEEVAEEHPEIKVGKVNTDEQPALAQKFGITAIPALFVVKDGQIVNKGVGAMPKEQVEALIR
ncbi:MAG: thioredoxin [Coriobacteriaceae bacterium]|nr:thioredoxin [Coriobacteriaceae bacterium]